MNKDTPLLDLSLRDLLQRQVTGSRQASILSLYDHHQSLFHETPGSSKNHQAWVGGYADHLAECLRINEATYQALKRNLRPLDFTLEEACLALFFHDIEKPFRYGEQPVCQKYQAIAGDSYDQWNILKWDIIADLEKQFDFALTQAEKKAVRLAHGEGDEYTNQYRVSSPLDAHVHHCDNSSARIYPEHGRGLG